MSSDADDCNCQQALRLQARINELERAIEERNINPELAAEWARRGYRTRCYEGTRAGCLWCTTLCEEDNS